MPPFAPAMFYYRLFQREGLVLMGSQGLVAPQIFTIKLPVEVKEKMPYLSHINSSIRIKKKKKNESSDIKDDLLSEQGDNA